MYYVLIFVIIFLVIISLLWKSHDKLRDFLFLSHMSWLLLTLQILLICWLCTKGYLKCCQLFYIFLMIYFWFSVLVLAMCNWDTYAFSVTCHRKKNIRNQQNTRLIVAKMYSYTWQCGDEIMYTFQHYRTYTKRCPL